MCPQSPPALFDQPTLAAGRCRRNVRPSGAHSEASQCSTCMGSARGTGAGPARAEAFDGLGLGALLGANCGARICVRTDGLAGRSNERVSWQLTVERGTGAHQLGDVLDHHRGRVPLRFARPGMPVGLVKYHPREQHRDYPFL